MERLVTSLQSSHFLGDEVELSLHVDIDADEEMMDYIMVNYCPLVFEFVICAVVSDRRSFLFLLALGLFSMCTWCAVRSDHGVCFIQFGTCFVFGMHAVRCNRGIFYPVGTRLHVSKTVLFHRLGTKYRYWLPGSTLWLMALMWLLCFRP